jgi:hypothetical protein
MSITIQSVNPVSQVAGAADTAPDLVLTPGTVVDARVLAMRDANLVRIAIEGLAIDVLTEVMLQPGANLKLAVSQAGDGIRLAILPQDGAAANAGSLANASAVTSSLTATNALRAQLPQALPADVAATAAIANAVQTAAPKQAGLSPLFANLPVIVAATNVPMQVQNAAAQLLTSRPQLDASLTANDLRQAFQKSGLFLETSLAQGAAPAGAPDLKAALVVFRQVLSSWVGQGATSGPALPQSAGQGVSPDGDAIVRTGSPPLAPGEAATPGDPVDGAVRSAAQALAREAGASVRNTEAQTLGDLASRALAQRSQQAGAATAGVLANGKSEPAPPFRGAAPSAQPVALPSIEPNASPASVGQKLLDQTDAALARQTLLQVASLPDRPELANANQTASPRWSFEIPFATPQGTAVAQFEIARDGGNENEGASSSSRIWRARFTLDVEPTGPVHALVSLIGEKTAVRMWAERPETAAQLRASTDALGQALRQAALEPGDILVGEGVPPRPATTRAGHFLDRAT